MHVFHFNSWLCGAHVNMMFLRVAIPVTRYVSSPAVTLLGHTQPPVEGASSADVMETKVCSRCRTPKAISFFSKHSRGTFGVQAYCKECVHSHYLEHKEDVFARARRRRSAESGREQERKWQRDRRTNFPIKRMIQEASVRARKRGFDFNLTEDDLTMPEFCPVLGIRLERKGFPRADSSPSIDRIDSHRGYIKGNVIIISWRANRIKSDATLEELELIAAFYRKIHENSCS